MFASRLSGGGAAAVKNCTRCCKSRFSSGGADSIKDITIGAPQRCVTPSSRSEEHTSELQSLLRISYAVFCLKKKKKNTHRTPTPLCCSPKNPKQKKTPT